MNLETTFQVFGKNTLMKNWKIIQRENVNIFNYVVNGKAIYTHNNHEYEMLPGHIYILPYTANCSRKLIDGVEFEHIFFDFISPVWLNLDDIIDIEVAQHKDLYYTLKALEEFFNANLSENGNLHYFPFKDNNQQLFDLASLYFHTILHLIDRIKSITAECDKRVLSAVDYMHKHYSENITIQSLAGFVYLEKGYFVKLFKKYMKMPPHAYLRKYRLDVAMMMLKSGLSVNDVSERCGYQSASAFSSALKKEFGITPSQVNIVAF